uniref:Glutathione S-transferase rho n=1 Tax=Oryzias sinensis TaxID=183150 RepID=A0A8C7X285_9TELE
MAKSMSLLWGAGSPPCWRVMITLEEKRLQGYKRKLLSFQKGEHKSQEVLELNPRGQLPAFRHGDVVVNESTAACLYLENRFQSQGNRLIPDSPAEQALVFQRMMEGLTLTDRLNSVIYYDLLVPEEERHDSTLKRSKETLSTELQLWEGYLQNVWSISNHTPVSLRLTASALFPMWSFIQTLSAGRFPKLAKYYSLLKERPSIKASWPPQWMSSRQGYGVLKDL